MLGISDKQIRELKLEIRRSSIIGGLIARGALTDSDGNLRPDAIEGAGRLAEALED